MKLEVHCHVQKSQLMDHILNHLSPVYFVIKYKVKAMIYLVLN